MISSSLSAKLGKVRVLSQGRSQVRDVVAFCCLVEEVGAGSADRSEVATVENLFCGSKKSIKSEGRLTCEPANWGARYCGGLE